MSAPTSEARLRRWLPKLGLGLVLFAVFVIFRAPLIRWFSAGPLGDAAVQAGRQPLGGATDAQGEDAIDHYTCPMHPSVARAVPGRCPICGMELVPVTRAQQQQGVVIIDEVRRQLIGVRVGSVVEAPLQRALRAVGQVTYDESKLTDVTLKVRGWITKLLVNETGQRVKRGQTLFQLYSPEVFSAEQDFLLVTRSAGAGAATSAPALLARGARQRLQLLGLAEAEIERLERRGTPAESVPFASPASGFVIEKAVVEGASVEAGMRLYRIAALDSVWVEAELYEADLAQVRVGQPVRVTLDYVPGRSYEGKVASVYPFLDPLARTGRIRVVLANSELDLRPGMYASVNLASAAELRVQVPASAVVYTGPRRLVFLDLGEGRFRPQEIRVGAQVGGMYEVLDGLKPGDRVATSGVFLIAAEARISTAAKYWERAPQEPPSPTLSQPAAHRAEPSVPGPSAQPARAAEKSPASHAPSEPVYSCPMHPEVQAHAPGQCPKCGMGLVLQEREGER